MTGTNFHVPKSVRATKVLLYMNDTPSSASLNFLLVFLFNSQGFRNVTSQINAIGVIFHGNDIAKGMKLRHFRDNVELPWISADKQYDSFYQSARVFAQPVRIEPVCTVMVFNIKVMNSQSICDRLRKIVK